MGYLKQLAGQTAIYGLSSVVPRLLNYLLVPLYTRILLPEEFGVITEMYAYLGFLLVLLTFGFETGFFRFSTKLDTTAERHNIYSTAFFTLLLTSTAFIVIANILSQPLVNILGYPSNPEYITLLSIIIGLDAFCSIPFARLRLENKPFHFSVIKISGVVLNVSLVVLFLVVLPEKSVFNLFTITTNNSITYILLSNCIASIFVTLVLIILTKPTSFSFQYSYLKSLLIYSIPLLISGIGGTTNESFDRIFIKFLVPDDQNPLYQLGIYGSNIKLAVLMILFIQMYRYAAEPFFFSTSNTKDSKIIYADLLKYFLIFCLLIFLIVGLYTDILQFIVGEKFREGLNVVPILLLANVFYGIFFNLSIWYKLTDKTMYGIYYTFAGAVVTITLNFTLIPQIGYYGAAIARLSCYIVMCLLCYYGSRKHYTIPYNTKRILFYLAFAIILFFLGFFIVFSNPLIYFLFRFTLISIYLVVVLIVEKVPLLNTIKSVIR